MSNLNEHQFGDYTVKYTGVHQSDGEREKFHHVDAVDADGEPVGSLRWSKNGYRPGEINSLYVRPEHQRQGLATQMYRLAKSVEAKPPPRHSRDRTDAGDAWAQSLGERLPKRY